MLDFQAVDLRYPDGTQALNGVTLEVPAGQFCVVVGSSGAGKSSLLRLVNGMTRPTAGCVRFGGEVIERRNLRAVQARVSMIHQQFHLVPRLTVLENVLCGVLHRVSTARSLLRWFDPRDKRRACELLDEVGLQEEHVYRRARQLSGGQQQRVAIARAFLPEPDLVLADEPVASLDPITSTTIMELLKRQSQAHGATVLCSLHQVELATEFADRIVGMSGGRIVFDGDPKDIDADAWSEVYEQARPST